MDAFFPMLKNVILFVLLAIPGYLLVKCKMLKQEQSGILSKLLMYVGLPFMILSGTLGITFNSDLILSLVKVALIGIALVFLFYFLSAILVKRGNLNEVEDKKRRMMRFCQTFANNGFLGLPLAAAVFGANSLVFTYMVVVNIINNLMMYALGTYLISGDKNTIKLKSILLNPVLIAFIVGIVLNLVGIQKIIPEVSTYSDHFKNIVTPLSMTILGMKLGGIKFSSLFTSKSMYVVSAVKLVLFPIIGTALTFLLSLIIKIDVNMLMCIFVSFAVPTAGLSSAFADRYNGDTDNSVIYTLGTTVLSVLTIPLLYVVLCLIV